MKELTTKETANTRHTLGLARSEEVGLPEARIALLTSLILVGLARSESGR